VYAGFSRDRLHSLLRGRLPAVVGRFPLYPTLALQKLTNHSWETPEETRLSDVAMDRMCANPLGHFLEGKQGEVEGYYSHAEEWLRVLQLGEDDQKSIMSKLNLRSTDDAKLIPLLVWELRQFLPESVAIAFLLEFIVKEYRDTKIVKGDADSKQQLGLFLIFCRICSREKAKEGAPGLPNPWEQPKNWDDWTERIHNSQQRILDAGLPYAEQLLLPVPLDEPLDSQCYASFHNKIIDTALSSAAQHALRQRLWNIGEVLRICTNVLSRSAALKQVNNVIRKCFLRVRYILDETFQRRWKSLTISKDVVGIQYDEGDEGNDEDALAAGVEGVTIAATPPSAP